MCLPKCPESLLQSRFQDFFLLAGRPLYMVLAAHQPALQVGDPFPRGAFVFIRLRRLLRRVVLSLYRLLLLLDQKADPPFG